MDADQTFTAALKRIGTALESNDLVELYPPMPPCPNGDKRIVLEKCKFFDLFDTDPAQAREVTRKKREEAEKEYGADFLRQLLRSNQHHPLKKNRRYDFRLTTEEKAKLSVNGFVVSDRMQENSFGDVYYQLYTDDLPVFVTADSILHAWHRSFDAFLVETEVKGLAPTLNSILNDTIGECEELETLMETHTSEYHNYIAKCVEDVQDYLIVALSLLRGKLLWESEMLKAVWTAIRAERSATIEVLSALRTIDFSQFKPRGHYTKSEKLRNYFRTMMWLGLVNFKLTGGNEEEDLHQLLCAVVLVHCLQASDATDSVAKVDSLLQSLVGDSDVRVEIISAKELASLMSADTSMSILELPCANVTGGADARSLLLGLHEQIGQKNRSTGVDTKQSLGEGNSTSFALFGQRFVWSAFIFSRLVYDQVVYNEEKQPRRIPSAVDIAFTLFGNNEAAKVLRGRMEAQETADVNDEDNTPDFVRHRDGIPITSNLVALRQMIDEVFDGYDERDTDSATVAETLSIGTLWTRALRALSQPSPNAADTFQSRTWQCRQMNTQIASFTQLRHDTVLYAKQSSCLRPQCEYPDGMVDPYPLFWQRMRELALRMENISEDAASLRPFSIHKRSREPFFEDFAWTMKQLEEIALCQVSKTPLEEDQVTFMKSVMEKRFGSGTPQYLGWYPSLFYDCREDSCERDVLVADVHTNYPFGAHHDPGCVLHLGVGDTVVGFFIVNGVMYAGPLFSSYEFVTPIDQRLTDEEFEEKLPWMRAPQWAELSYLQSAFESTSGDEEEIQHKRNCQEGKSYTTYTAKGQAEIYSTV